MDTPEQIYKRLLIDELILKRFSNLCARYDLAKDFLQSLQTYQDKTITYKVNKILDRLYKLESEIKEIK